MKGRAKRRQTLEEILASCSAALFPDALGSKEMRIDSTGADGDTPLHVVLRRANSRAAKVLIEAGADVNAKGDMSETPLHLAIRNADVAIVQMLREKGANPDARSDFGRTPRDEAQLASRELVQALR